METRYGLSPRRGITPALLGGVIAVAAIGGFWAARSATQGPDRAAMRTVAASSAATVAANLDADERQLVAASEAVGGNPSAPNGQLIAGLSRVAPDDRVMAIVRTASTASAAIAVKVPPQPVTKIVGFDLAQQPAVRLALELARDGGATETAVGTGPDGQMAVIEVAPLYGSLDIPADVASRRSSLQGFVVMFGADASRFGLPEPDNDGNIAVRVVQGDTTLATSGRLTDHAPLGPAAAAFVNTTGVSWTVQAWSVETGSSLPLVVLIVGLVFALAAATLAARRERAIQRSAANAEARAQELALVARAGPLLQQGLDLSDLVPVFVVEISDEFALEGVSISLVSDAGRLVRVFSLGGTAEPFNDDPSELITPQEEVAPSEVISVPLARGGRVVGALRARAARGLSVPQVDTLVAVCNLLAAALGNARLFQAEQEMVGRLREVDRMKTTFVSSVSHELRTTVTAIEGFAGLLVADKRSADGERQADFIERIRRNARSLVVLVEDLLDFARFERSGLAIELKPIDLSDLVPDVVDQMSSLLGERPVSMAVEPGVVVMGDLSAVERILVNLLSNAAKYTPPDSPVEVMLERDEDVAALIVADHGPGIGEDEREKIFELFYRVDDQSAIANRGIGIGLALARQLVGQLDGTITVAETAGGGASFRVTIPLVEAPVSTRPASATLATRPS